jgi:3-phosphoshikimate 1-carboxyvinyltransferase
MNSFVVKPISCLKGKISPLGDKSIAHRSIIISSLCKSKTQIKNFPINKDCLLTIAAFKKLGIKITFSTRGVTVSGNGLYGLKEPKGPIFVGDSGTTLRLLLGVLAGQNFKTKLIAGKSLSKRPMLRVTSPLRLMGAVIDAKRRTRNANHEEYPPITIKGGGLRPISYKLPVASAQVKSAILLAGLFANGTTRISEPVLTRDHTERMLKLFKTDIKVKPNNVAIKGNRELASIGRIIIPGDISSAAFFIVLAAILRNSQILIRNVSLNPSRMGVIRVLKRMKLNIRVSLTNSRLSRFEPAGNILVNSSSLKATTVKKEEIPSLIDELPILMVASCFAKGRTVFFGVNELRIKETDRIRSMTENLNNMGGRIRISKENSAERITVEGVGTLNGAKIKSFGDHRTVMSMIVAALAAVGASKIDDISCISKSFPDFLKLLKTLIYPRKTNLAVRAGISSDI